MTSKTLDKLISLVDKGLAGKLQRAIDFTDEPRFHQYFSIDNLYDEDAASGVGFSDNEDYAKIKAIAEYIERVSLETVDLPTTIATYEELGDDAINPERFVNFRDVDLKNRKDEYIKHLKSSKISWVEAESLSGTNKILVPAQLVYVPFPEKEPMIRPQVSTGAAAQNSPESARFNGLLEAIERDSFMLKYLSKSGSPKINLKGELKQLEQYFNRYRLDINVFDITSDIGVPSYLCVNIDRTGLGPAVSLGAKVGFDPEVAVKGAILESQQIRQWIRYSYLAQNQPKISNPSQINNMKERGFYWYGEERISDVDFFHNGEFSEFENLDKNKLTLEEVVLKIGEHGIDTYFVDITPKKYSDSGIFVSKAIAPNLHPLFLEDKYPCYDSERLNKLLWDGKVNTQPVPFL